jgi:hypothetical protein
MLHHIYRQIFTDISKKHKISCLRVLYVVFLGHAVQEACLIAGLIDP